MSLIKLTSLATKLARRNSLQSISSQSRRTFKSDKDSTVKKSNDDDDDEVDEPIKYSTSPAAEWTAAYSQSGCKYDEIPKYQPAIVNISVAIFLIYFTLLREPNDLNEILDKELSDHVKHIDVEALKKTAGVPTYDQDKKYTK